MLLISNSNISLFLLVEVRHVMIVFGLLFIAWLFGGLHMAYGYLWMIIIFILLNCIIVGYI